MLAYPHLFRRTWSKRRLVGEIVGIDIGALRDDYDRLREAAPRCFGLETSWPLQDGGSVRFLDDQIPLKQRRSDTGCALTRTSQQPILARRSPRARSNSALGSMRWRLTRTRWCPRATTRDGVRRHGRNRTDTLLKSIHLEYRHQSLERRFPRPGQDRPVHEQPRLAIHYSKKQEARSSARPLALHVAGGTASEGAVGLGNGGRRRSRRTCP